MVTQQPQQSARNWYKSLGKVPFSWIEEADWRGRGELVIQSMVEFGEGGDCGRYTWPIGMTSHGSNWD